MTKLALGLLALVLVTLASANPAHATPLDHHVIAASPAPDVGPAPVVPVITASPDVVDVEHVLVAHDAAAPMTIDVDGAVLATVLTPPDVGESSRMHDLDMLARARPARVGLRCATNMLGDYAIGDGFARGAPLVRRE